MVAEAVVPPGPPSNVFRNRGTRCTPGVGLRPLHPAWGDEGAAFSPWRVGTLPSLPPRVGVGMGRAPGGGGLSRDSLGIVNEEGAPSTKAPLYLVR